MYKLQNIDKYDVIVIGGGHSGCEASLASARLGFYTLLVTISIDRIAALSCNPSIGGVGKSHLVKEIDALGGAMPKVADATSIHLRTLNLSKGPAVQSTRCQVDMDLYKSTMLNIVLNTKNLSILQDEVFELIINSKKYISGIKTKYSGKIYSNKVILTAGTFLNGYLHVGNKVNFGGRIGEPSSYKMSKFLKNLGFSIGRLKTGTCPRLDSRTIDFNCCEEQISEISDFRFCFEPSKQIKQISCWMTHTIDGTHKIIKSAIRNKLAPSYNGQINAIGPRYCPSIEDKVSRFSTKDSHHIFLEPQGLNTYEVYPNGLTTSLPPSIQLEFLRTIPGLRSVHVTRWGYAVEYDFLDPKQCFSSLESKLISGLYLAGQINGTTGYEEAAIQGLLAGLNVSRALSNKNPIILNRHEAYGGVLIDDLVTKEISEPYRIFTSRAEYRLLLREDNVYKRLSKVGFQSGLLKKKRFDAMTKFEFDVTKAIEFFKETNISVNNDVLQILNKLNSSVIKKPVRLSDLAKRSEITCEDLLKLCVASKLKIDDNFKKYYRAVIELKYEGYISRSIHKILNNEILDKTYIPKDIFKNRFSGLRTEFFEKLCYIKPQTLGQASRISGMTPAALSLIALKIKQHLKDV